MAVALDRRRLLRHPPASSWGRALVAEALSHRQGQTPCRVCRVYQGFVPRRRRLEACHLALMVRDQALLHRDRVEAAEAEAGKSWGRPAGLLLLLPAGRLERPSDHGGLSSYYVLPA